MKAFWAWFGDAEWWHFWNPGSGISGGAILGLLIGLSIKYFA